MANLQFRCSNPFGTEGEGAALFGAMLRAPFPKVRRRLAVALRAALHTLF